MKMTGKRADYVDTTYLSRYSVDCSREPDLYVPKCGFFEGTNRFVRRFVLPYETTHIVTKGHWSVELDGQPFDLYQGDLIVIFKGQDILAKDDPDDNASHYWIDLKGELLQDILDGLGVSPEAPLRKGRFDLLLEPLMNEMMRAYETEEYLPTFPMAMAWRIVELLGRSFASAPQSMDLAARAKDMIDKHYSSGISVMEIADDLQVDRTTLFRHFKNMYGESPKQYLDRVRVECAMSLLEHTPHTVGEICSAVGYSHQQNFFRAFKRHTGSSPLSYRNR
jgi:AraC-like DNA-binding protein